LKGKLLHFTTHRPDGTARRAKINGDDAREIVRLFGEGIGKHELAAQFGVSYSTINAIIGGRIWNRETVDQRRQLNSLKGKTC
jgi:DNA invertase Pin-like site-specific DNA recombinase